MKKTDKESGKTKKVKDVMGVVHEIVSEAASNEENQDCPCCPDDDPGCVWPENPNSSQKYSYFETLDPFYPFVSDTTTTLNRLGENEMRITFMGSVIPMNMRKTQQEMSVFVEVGWDEERQCPRDQFVFDCGSGVSTNYNAMNVNLGRMNKIFINHLHADHMSDLTHIYCFGPSQGRVSPLYVFGQSNSGITCPQYLETPSRKYDDGVNAFCQHLRNACRWHTESFSFQSTMGEPNPPSQDEIKRRWGLPVKPEQVLDDTWGDGYAMVPIELPWDREGVAYHNKETGVKITHFPVIHTRRGAIGYKLEWTTPRGEILTMMYTSDTKPETKSLEHACNRKKGVDVFIHEMIVPPQIWIMKMGHMHQLPDMDSPGVQSVAMVQHSSHTPQGAFGYLLSQIEPKPRLTVATHFPVADDTVACAMKSVRKHVRDVYQGPTPCGGKNPARITWSSDLMVISVTKEEIKEMRAEINDYEFSATVVPPTREQQILSVTPKYHKKDQKQGDPYAQIDLATAIPPCTGIGKECKCNYRPDGY